jgi:hypothetical protein
MGSKNDRLAQHDHLQREELQAAARQAAGPEEYMRMLTEIGNRTRPRYLEIVLPNIPGKLGRDVASL